MVRLQSAAAARSRLTTSGDNLYRSSEVSAGIGDPAVWLFVGGECMSSYRARRFIILALASVSVGCVPALDLSSLSPALRSPSQYYASGVAQAAPVSTRSSNS